MTIEELYFEWLCECVGSAPDVYLLQKLYSTDYVWVARDSSRAQDGIELRYHFANLRGIAFPLIEHYFLGKQCSMLEMMLALCNTIEYDYLANDDVPKWFNMMINTLGLAIYMRNDVYNETEVDKVLMDFMAHKYMPNGVGSLFFVPEPVISMRDLSLWDQMNQWMIWKNQTK